MLEILSVCHTVVVEDKKGRLSYNASSPDELALVNGAKYLGYDFKRRDDEDNVIVENSYTKEEMHFKLLNVIEFNSTRKRMTVIVRNPDGKIVVMCKGADSIILPLLRSDLQHVDNTVRVLENFSREGLRTLLLA
jgi:phospholipid-transporting ATPase